MTHAVYDAVIKLIDEMDGRQRTDTMVQYMQQLLIEVNRATPDQVTRVLADLAHARDMSDNNPGSISNTQEGGGGDDSGGVGGRW
jgi:hypothetical protein